jgi:uncharacterized protein (TIGR03437 family)
MRATPGSAGMDADGRTWTQQATLTLVAPFRYPEMTLNAAPSNVQQNPAADASCQWSQQLLLQEQSGLSVQLTRFLAGGMDLTAQIPQLFGTSQLAPFGALQASMCWPSGTSSQSIAYEVDGTDSTGSPITASFNSTLSPPALSPATLSLSTESISLAAAPQMPTASASLNLTGDGVQWTVNVFPSNQITTWLSVTPTSGSGSQAINLRGSATGLATGVYNATLVFQATNTIPQFIEVPVTFTVGSATGISIGGMANGASYQPAYAPGMVLSIFGAQLAPSTQAAGSVPLPLTLAGVSATVNGVAAPLYYVSPSQLNIQIPYETGAGRAVLGVNNNGQVAAAAFKVTPAAPGIFTDPSNNLVPKSAAKPGDTLSLFLTGDGTVTPSLASGASPVSGTPLDYLPRPGLPVAVTIAGIPATIVFAGIPPSLVGTTQINFVIPSDAAAGTQTVIVSVAGASSQPANLLIVP